MSGTSAKGIMERYGGEAILIAGELAKKNAERRAIHEMLTDYGVPDKSANGEGMCLQNRILLALDRCETLNT